jgi:ribonuclease M5
LIHIDQVFVVEGRYDRNKLSQIFDAAIIETDGFGIFKQPEKMELLRHLAETRGIIVFTDSDGAGFLIRNRIKSAISTGNVFHAYIPDIIGKEKRKNHNS